MKVRPDKHEACVGGLFAIPICLILQLYGRTTD